MEKLTATICVALAVLLRSAGDSESFSETPYWAGIKAKEISDYKGQDEEWYIEFSDDGKRFTFNYLIEKVVVFRQRWVAFVLER